MQKLNENGLPVIDWDSVRAGLIVDSFRSHCFLRYRLLINKTDCINLYNIFNNKHTIAGISLNARGVCLCTFTSLDSQIFFNALMLF